ncbi:hypothetical protein BHE74_00036553 [Ensete ventricosum]|nr:hypothetical protein BHE74_00036553 [Ensete ventricosum]
MIRSPLSILLLESPEGGPREGSPQGRFWSLLFSTTNILVGPLQHLRYSYRGSLHKRPKKAGRPDPDHKSLDDQRWMRIRNGPDFVCEAGEVLSEVFLLFLSHPEEERDSWFWSGAREEVAFEHPWRNGAGRLQSGSSVVAHLVAMLFLSEAGELLGAVSSAVRRVAGCRG